ncbi:hypothetical protein DO65_6190 [Burkholderia pseudomallei]|nr:hypothetical protein DO65_6190 [Burkholderia pseudomallei]KGD03225.1 hypothetical protein DO63_5855 [Burkholderia pseudomallei]KOS95089.1 hypothetical protein DM45_3885 [Burkholderia mallei]
MGRAAAGWRARLRSRDLRTKRSTKTWYAEPNRRASLSMRRASAPTSTRRALRSTPAMIWRAAASGVVTLMSRFAARRCVSMS